MVLLNCHKKIKIKLQNQGDHRKDLLVRECLKKIHEKISVP